MSSLPSALAALSFLASSALAGGGDPAPGFRLYSATGDTVTHLVDTDGVIVHEWTSPVGPTAGIFIEPDGTLLRSVNHGTGPAIGGSGGGIQRSDFDGTLTWDFIYDGPDGVLHHDLAELPNGNVLAIAWELLTDADAIAAGRDPALLGGTAWFPDTVIEFEQTGPTTANIVWQWKMMDHVVQNFDNTKPNFADPADHPERLDINYPPTVVSNGDWNHSNSLDYDPINDVIILSSPFQNEFWIIDHSTTTSEAAGSTGGNFGKGGDFLYRWGNPIAYGAGDAGDQKLFFHHSTHVIPQGLPGAGNILIFNNRAGTPVGEDYSSVVELELPASFDLDPGAAWGPTDFIFEYTNPVPTDFYSGIVSSARRLPNGNTLVCAGNQMGWMFEITPAKDIVWEHFNQTPATNAVLFQATYWERYLWADREEISTSAGGLTSYDLVAGSKHANHFYWMLGSVTGTSPGITLGSAHVPLNLDSYMRVTLLEPNSVIHPGTFGVLDGLGNGSAGFFLPPGLASPLAGIEVNHAYFVVDPLTIEFEFASGALPLQLLP